MSEQKSIAEARPASTVVLIRDGEDGLETLLLKRNQALLFAGGFWVFPGGAIDPADIEAAGDDMEQAARIAAVREAVEEANIKPDLERMSKISHWTTPTAERKRFATWFYAAPCPAGATVTIDGSEIHDSLWITVTEAISRQDAGTLAMLPPTYLTLCQLAGYCNVDDALNSIAGKPSPSLLPVFSFSEDKVVVLFKGDSGFECSDATVVGPRHRAELKDEIWQYIFDDIDGVTALDGR